MLNSNGKFHVGRNHAIRVDIITEPLPKMGECIRFKRLKLCYTGLFINLNFV